MKLRNKVAVEQVTSTAGRIDILVNNAAVFDMAPFLEITKASIDCQSAVSVRVLNKMVEIGMPDTVRVR